MTALNRIEILETCLDGTMIIEMEIDRKMDEALMRRLAENDVLDFYPTFPKPYFRICLHRTDIVQGVIGNRTFRVTCEIEKQKQTIGAIRRRIEEELQHGSKTQKVL